MEALEGSNGILIRVMEHARGTPRRQILHSADVEPGKENEGTTRHFPKCREVFEAVPLIENGSCNSVCRVLYANLEFTRQEPHPIVDEY